MAQDVKRVAWFKEIDKNDIAIVGGKGANLGEMTRSGFPVPPGFIVTAQAYFEFIKLNNLEQKIKHLMSTVDYKKQDSLQQVSNLIKKEIMRSEISEKLKNEIFDAYGKLGGIFKDTLVAVRSSATAEDLATASFAGQQETFLNVKGEAVLMEKIKEGWASLFEPRAMFYRHEQHFDHIKVGIALVVQKMIESEKSGIMFTIDPVSNDKSKVVIDAIFGLGEMIVQGAVTPDHYEVDKKELKITTDKRAYQKVMMVKSGTGNKLIKLSQRVGLKRKISDKEILELTALGLRLEHHYYFPQDIEWAIEKNKVYIVQTRAITTTENTRQNQKEDLKGYEVILTGNPASPGIASGPVKILRSARENDKILPGDVLVASQTNPDFVPAMKKAAAIITDSGGRTSHAAIVSRELGIPAVVGTQNATIKLKNDMVVTVNGLKGEVYKGGHFKVQSEIKNTAKHSRTATKVYVNLAEPEIVDRVASRNVDGVGLLRAEFMMAGIGIHPKKLIKDGKQNVFVDKMAEGISTFCKAFSPRPVIYRTSDFKTNEYRSLIGGKEFEPVEPNPMLGYRGAYRYIHNPEVFKLELKAIKKVRDKMGYKNLWVMLPFVRTVKELEEVKKILMRADLHRSPTFKLLMMVEIPSNVILLPKFIECGIDGVSIGSNDLTMLILGTDRDNDEVAPEFDERNDAVLWAFEHVIKTAHKYRITSSVCGQSVSTYPDLVEKLVSWGVTSVSVSPDAIENTRETIAKAEKKLING